MTRHEAPTWRRFVALSVFVSMLIISGLWIAGKADAVDKTTYDGVGFWTQVTGSGDLGFDVYASYDGEGKKECEVKVSVIWKDGGDPEPCTFTNTVRKTDKMWFGGKAGLKGAIKEVKIISGSCK